MEPLRTQQFSKLTTIESTNIPAQIVVTLCLLKIRLKTDNAKDKTRGLLERFESAPEVLYRVATDPSIKTHYKSCQFVSDLGS